MDFELSDELRAVPQAGPQVGRQGDPEGLRARRSSARSTSIRSSSGTSSPRPATTALSVPEEYGGEGGDVLTQMVLARELCRSLGGLSWVWGLTSFAGSKSVGLYGTRRAEGALAAGDRRGQAALLDRLHRARRRHRRARRDEDPGREGRRRLEDQRRQGLVQLRPTSPTTSWCWRAPTTNVAKRHQGVTLFLLAGQGRRGADHASSPKLGMRAIGSCQVTLRDVFVPDDRRARRARPGVVHAAADAQQRAHDGRRVLLRDPRRRARGRARLRQAAQGVRQGDRRVPDDPELHRRDRDDARPGRADGLPRRATCSTPASRATWSRAWPRSSPPSTRSRPPTSASPILGGMGYSAETDMQRYWRDARLWKIGPITNEMARNAIAEQLGLPRSF